MARKRTIPDDSLLSAARACFIERGFAVPTKAIARRAGVSEGLLFQRYGNKAELFLTAMAPPPGAAFSAQLALAPVEGVAGLVALGEAMLDYFRGIAEVLLPLLSYPEFQFEDFAQRHPDSALSAMRWQAVSYFQRAGVRDPAASALLLMSSLFGVVMFEKLGAHGGVMPADMVRRMLQRIAESG
jgi:AcrR family transcriptional regulator